MNHNLYNMNNLMQQLPAFKQQMQQQGITDARAEVMKRLQGQNMTSPKMQLIQTLMTNMGLKF